MYKVEKLSLKNSKSIKNKAHRQSTSNKDKILVKRNCYGT